MAQTFSLKPLVLALSMGFGAIAMAHAADGDELSLGSCSLNCTPEKLQKQAADFIVPEVKRSGAEALPTDYTRITADEVSGQTNVETHAEGDVIVEHNDQVLNAQWVDYNQQTNTISAGDGFVLYQNGTIISGEKTTYHLVDGTGETTHTRLVADHEGRRLQSVSERAEIVGKGRYVLHNTKFNTCEPGDAGWYIQAKTIKTDESTGIGVAEHAKLVFGGVPVLYTPWADFPLYGKRKSGLLVPNASIGSDGLELGLPYYFNLAPNYDAILAPGVISRRGVKLDGQFRYLQPSYQGQAEGTWMPYDSKADRSNRYQVRWAHQQHFTTKLSGGVDFNQVSDNNYYRDFYGQDDIVRNVNLNRQAWLNYHNRLWGGSWDSYATVQDYQTLANTSGYKDKPYALMPRISSRWQKNIGNAQINAFAQFTRFQSDTKRAGNRVVLYPSVKWNFHNEWGYVRPKVGLHATYYDLDSFENSSVRHVSRVLPIMNIDSGLTFERRANIFGNGYIQTLEPRLFYNYIPTKSQNNLPNFDSSENSFTYEQLFRENLYSGNDRINSANSLTTAVQTRLLNDETGAERFRAGIGQKFYFKNDSVLLDGSVSRYQRSRSDWVAFAHGNISNSVRFDTDIHYNENQRRMEDFAAGVMYHPEAGKVLSAHYKYGRSEPIYLQNNGEYYYDKLSQIDLAAQWPISNNLYGIARYNYSLNGHKPLQVLAGLEYKNPCGCWSASVVGQHYITGLNSSKNAVLFNIQLKNLSNLGKNPIKQLRLAIPGYTKTNEVITK